MNILFLLVAILYLFHVQVIDLSYITPWGRSFTYFQGKTPRRLEKNYAIEIDCSRSFNFVDRSLFLRNKNKFRVVCFTLSKFPQKKSSVYSQQILKFDKQ
jgi:hypothetical protein